MPRVAAFVALALAATGLRADSGPFPALKNPGFEEGAAGEAPPGWHFPEASAAGGYTLTLTAAKPFAGKLAAVLERKAKEAGEAFGNAMQVVDATAYRGKRVRFRAAVRAAVAGDGGQARLWLRVDRPADAEAFFDNMADRPITAAGWRHYEIVGDVAADAETINVGLVLVGRGTAALDDCSLEAVDKSVAVTGVAPIAPGAPGLAEVRQASDVTATGDADAASFLYPLPLAYRDQVPLTFHLRVTPPEAGKGVEILTGPGPNRTLKLALTGLKTHRKVSVAYQALMLVRPTAWDGVPKAARFPAEWPAEAKPWLAATWCCDAGNDRVRAMAKEVRGDGDDVLAVIRAALRRSQECFGKAEGRVGTLTAVEALDRQGSCTSCANLVAALLRGAGVPARVLAGYPLWSGPLQTHYIVEAWVPGYGWYPVESSMGKAPWANDQQVAVSVVPVEHEAEAKAGHRRNVAGGVPYLSLTERPDGDAAGVFSVGTLPRPFCDHEARMVRPLKAAAAEWAAAFAAATPRWDGWLKSSPALKDGKLGFGPAELKAATLPAVMNEVRRP